ncbi:5-methyltetrahydropteroyltriglutamate--homocysteine S-methyltransferase [Desulfovibrio sp.]|uniref:5-methyltetrahydropteroyltriglutamate-- homocysteine S-methyltransferase n=1 Tax=Desulfovibrio sp. TaxID=885 RepID=UPI0025B9DB1F|nr:5-methyltetrahydropteroyltriglutamate--homocysteine S-methyltransferase [Desulfovibrio sp.]
MQTHILGFPSIGRQRELKQVLESFWRGDTCAQTLTETTHSLQQQHWHIQQLAGLTHVTTGDFSLYDRMLDTSLMLGAVPSRFAPCGRGGKDVTTRYFAMARGDAARNIPAMEMTKWFDTNYHYLVPEIETDAVWTPGEHPVLEATTRAAALGFSPKAAVIGPFTWLALAKGQTKEAPWARLDEVLKGYVALIERLAPLCKLIQIEEPVLCTDLLPDAAAEHFAAAYAALNAAARPASGALMLTTYFGPLTRHLPLAVNSGCAALHIDLARAPGQLDDVLATLPDDIALSLGLVNGRNIWKTSYAQAADLAERAVKRLGSDRVLLGSSCSLLHCPVDLAEETELPLAVRDRMAFAVQKCSELAELETIALGNGSTLLAANAAQMENARQYEGTVQPAVRQRTAAITPDMLERRSCRGARRAAQDWLRLPLLPTTTIGSFPQTESIRKTRRAFRQGQMGRPAYEAAIQEEIAACIKKQEVLGLDVLVHGEAERNDMVEYFGQQLGGFCFTRNGWVQSYGSRCVKPPVIYGDVYRKEPMTVRWARYAQSLTQKPVKGMLTGPVTILCWSFVRDDLPRSEVCRQIALAIRDEVQDLEKAGIGVIQIDEAALREGMPLTALEAEKYLQWAVDAFLLASTGVEDRTQIHTHMCYSEFNAILPSIARMDADVISIESSRSGMELLDAFTRFHYDGQVGPGVYDIHSPRIPTADEMARLLRLALKHVDKDRLWVNPDCGLKTRQWEEAWPALENMVAAALRVRAEL